MPKLIHEPITITVSPDVRAIMRRDKDGNAIEVADIQVVIKALSHENQRQADRIKLLEDKIHELKGRLDLTRKDNS